MDDTDQLKELADLYWKRHGRIIPIRNVADAEFKPLTQERLAELRKTLETPTPAAVVAHVAERNGVEPEIRDAWWKKPVEGWPYELRITSIMSGETTFIPLEDKKD